MKQIFEFFAQGFNPGLQKRVHPAQRPVNLLPLDEVLADLMDPTWHAFAFTSPNPGLDDVLRDGFVRW